MNHERLADLVAGSARVTGSNLGISNSLRRSSMQGGHAYSVRSPSNGLLFVQLPDFRLKFTRV